MPSREAEHTRAREWVFHYLRGHVREAVAVEMSGPPIKPSDVIAAVIGELAAEHTFLMPLGG